MRYGFVAVFRETAIQVALQRVKNAAYNEKPPDAGRFAGQRKTGKTV